MPSKVFAAASLCRWLLILSFLLFLFSWNNNSSSALAAAAEEDHTTTTQENPTAPTDACTPSQTDLALEMARLSSKEAHQKLKHILSRHKYFYVDLGGDQKVFDSVADNIRRTLKGYGLQLTDNPDQQPVLRVETFFSSGRKAHHLDPSSSNSILFLQTEQICCSRYGQLGLPYLEKCHESPHCLMWEYSQTNWQFLQEKGLAGSVLLVPFLLQQRLDEFYPPQVPWLADRSIDVVFFGVMTERRKHIQQQLAQVVETHGLHWNLLLKEVGNSGSQLDYMAQNYLNAKICLIIHGFGDQTPGEYHRLSELAASGCLPIVEPFGDVVGTDVFSTCGGVLFTPLGQMPNMIQTVLQTISPHESFRLNSRLNWWKGQVQWDRLLGLILEEQEEEEDGVVD